MKELVRIATRESALALWQANWVANALREAHSGLRVELVTMTTEGDRFLAAPLSTLDGKGMFVKELEVALQNGTADIAVHSMKDVPVQFPDGLCLATICERGDPTDALVVRGDVRGRTLQSLAPGACVGTASLRRASQVRALRPDIQTAPVRGNVQTRLAKLDAGDFDAIVLACAGLERLGLQGRITQRLQPPEFMPAGGQGAVGIEAREDDVEMLELLAPLAHAPTTRCVTAEREVSRLLGGNCSVPLAAHCVVVQDGLALHGLVSGIDGAEVVRSLVRGNDPLEIGARCARELLEAGAGPLLEAAIAGNGTRE